MRLVLIAAFISGCHSLATAQGSQFAVTILPQIGVTFSDLQNSDSRITETKRTGSLYGASFIFHGERDNVGLLIGAHYVQKGGQESLSLQYTDGSSSFDEATTRLNYIDLSLQGRGVVLHRENFRLYLRAGFVYALGLNGDTDGSFTATNASGFITYQSSYSYKLKFVRNAASRNSTQYHDVGSVTACSGIGLIIKRVTIDFGYSGGFLRLSTSNDTSPTVNQVFQISAGFALRKINL